MDAAAAGRTLRPSGADPSPIGSRDYPILQGGILFVSVVFVLVNLAVDVLYAVINPRIRVS